MPCRLRHARHDRKPMTIRTATARKLYGRRKGPKLSARQAGLRRTLLSRSGLVPGRRPAGPVSEQRSGPLAGGRISAPASIWSGRPRQHPEVGLIGAEPYEMGMAKLLTKLEETPAEQCSPVMKATAATSSRPCRTASLGRFFLLFPDPWPKTRHHKRRFLQMEMLDDLARVLKPGAELRFATDDKSYLPLCAGTADGPSRPLTGWPQGPATGSRGPQTGRQPAMKPRRSRARLAFLRFVRSYAF